MLVVRYNAHGLSFNYTPEIKVSAFPRPGRGMNIKVEGPGTHGHMFGFVAMNYLEKTTPEKAFSDAVRGIEMVYEEPMAKIEKRSPVERNIGGVRRTGERFQIAFDQNPVLELYAFDLNGRTLCISVQYDSVDAEKFDAIFSRVLESLA